MSTSTESSSISVSTPDGSFDAALSRPAAPNGNAVVVVQEIFGVTKKIRAYCDIFAREGYLAAAPDMFWRDERNIQLGYSEEEVKRAMGLAKTFDEAKGRADIKALIERLRADGARKVCVVGFCLGGRLAALAAASGDADAGIGFYGFGLENEAAVLGGTGAALQLHYGDKDHFITTDSVEKVKAALGAATRAEVHRYAEAGHAFFRPDLKDESSQQAWVRAQEFLKRHMA